jgi:hypothetical protein
VTALVGSASARVLARLQKICCGAAYRWLARWREKVGVLRRLHRRRLGRWIARPAATWAWSVLQLGTRRRARASYGLFILVFRLVILLLCVQLGLGAIHFLCLSCFSRHGFLFVLLLFRLGYCPWLHRQQNASLVHDASGVRAASHAPGRAGSPTTLVYRVYCGWCGHIV